MLLMTLLLIRFVCCAILLSSGISKLVSSDTPVMSIVSYFIQNKWKNYVRVISCTEIFLAYWVFVLPSLNELTFVILALFALFISSYGVISVRETGHCGCTSASQGTTVTRFIARNLLLFGLLLSSVLLGPSFIDMKSTVSTIQFALTTIVFAVSPIIVIAIGVVRAWMSFRTPSRLLGQLPPEAAREIELHA